MNTSNKRNNKKLTGAALAFAAAALAGCGSTAKTSDGDAMVSTATTATDMIHCYSVNKCKGHNDCKAANNACKGQGSCKGSGFVAMPSKSCADIGGTVSQEWTGTASTADMSHCYSVNVCKGHNDCKTADNACKGHASCKGSGFVMMGESACGDVGGKTSA
jgi:hypothetical protein